MCRRNLSVLTLLFVIVATVWYWYTKKRIRTTRHVLVYSHTHMVLSIIMMDRIVKECSHFLSEWQVDFLPQRGCHDNCHNILLLRVMIDIILMQSEEECLSDLYWLLYRFWQCHKFLDKSLAKAGASRKTRAMFRAIYAAVNGVWCWCCACTRPQATRCQFVSWWNCRPLIGCKRISTPGWKATC